MRRSYDVITQMGICRFMVSDLPSCQLSLAFLTSTVQLKSAAPYLDDNIMMSYRPLAGWSSLNFGTSSCPHTYPHVHMPGFITTALERENRSQLQEIHPGLWLTNVPAAQTESCNGALWADELTHSKWGFPSERMTRALRIQGELNCLLMTPMALKTL